MFVCWGIVVWSAEWCSVFRSVMADRQQCLAIRSQRIRNRFAAVGVRFIVPVYTYSPRIRNPFRIHSRNVCNVFVFCMLHIRITKVWFLTCKSMVFVVQKYGFWCAKRGFLSYKSMVFVFWTLHCCNPFATYSQSVSSAFAIRKQRIRTRLPRIRRIFAALLQSVSSAFAPHKQRCCNLFAIKKPKPSMCIEEFRPPKILWNELVLYFILLQYTPLQPVRSLAKSLLLLPSEQGMVR